MPRTIILFDTSRLRQIFGELVQSSGPALLHAGTRCVECLALYLISMEGDAFNRDRRSALLLGEEKCRQRFERPSGAHRVTGEVACFVGEGIDKDDALWAYDFAINKLAPHRAAIRRAQAVMIDAAGAQIHTGGNHPEAFGPHQRFMRSGSVNAFHTRSRGTSKVRAESVAAVRAFSSAMLLFHYCDWEIAD
jgi:hypothetical protein